MKFRSSLWLNHDERKLLPNVLANAAEDDQAIRDLAAALAGQIPGLGPTKALELLAVIGWLILEVEHDR